MAAGLVIVHDSNQSGNSTKKFLATVANAGTLNGSVEGIIHFPTSSGGWRLTRVILAAGVNTTHSSGGTIGATVEKNTDGGTTALTTAPAMTDAAGTGRKVIDSNDSNSTGLTKAVIVTTSAADFADSDTAFVTLTEAGSGGTDPSDVSVALEFTEIQDFDPLPQ